MKEETVVVAEFVNEQNSHSEPLLWFSMTIVILAVAITVGVLVWYKKRRGKRQLPDLKKMSAFDDLLGDHNINPW